MSNPLKYYNDYRNKWKSDTLYFKESGMYPWMEESVSDHTKILEIGCGIGESTKTLLEKGHQLVSIEENPFCLSATFDLLKDDFRVIKIQRGTIHTLGRMFNVSYRDIKSVSSEFDLILVEGNILNDPGAHEFLSKMNFDAVVCWLMGTYGNLVFENKRLEGFSITSPSEYRLRVQNKVYDKAHEWLRTGGCLNIVDRGQFINTKELMNEVVRCHREQAEGTQLVVDGNSLRNIEIDFSDIEGGVQYGFTRGIMEDGPLPTKFGLSSISAFLE